MRNKLIVGALMVLSCGLATAAENDAANNAWERAAAAQANAAARACIDRSEERRVACNSAAMSDAAKQACYKSHEDDVKANCSAANAR